MPSFFNWNPGSSGMFNRKNRPCAILQGGVFLGMSIAASQALTNPRASRWEISNALGILTLTYGALSEKPYLWSMLLFLVLGTKTRGLTSSSTLPKELNLAIPVLAMFGILTPWFRVNEEDAEITPGPKVG